MSKKANKANRKAEAAKRRKHKKIALVCAAAAVVMIIMAITMSSRDTGAAERVRESADIDVDIDLVAMSDTMVYAALLNIMRNPIPHLGQTIRVGGSYQPFFWHETGSYYHFVVVEGQAGCCPQRMEFMRGDDYVFPADFPAEGAMIEVIGVFSRAGQWFYLAVDEFLILD